MNRRRILAFLGLASASAAQDQDLQISGKVHGPRCPVCGTEADIPDQWLVTSSAGDALTPTVWSGVKVNLCPKCGLFFGTKVQAPE